MAPRKRSIHTTSRLPTKINATNVYLYTGWWVGRKQSRLWHTIWWKNTALESAERVRVMSQSDTPPSFLNPELMVRFQCKFLAFIRPAPSSPPSSPVFVAVCRNPSLPASPLPSPKTTVPSSACLSWNYPISTTELMPALISFRPVPFSTFPPLHYTSPLEIQG